MSAAQEPRFRERRRLIPLYAGGLCAAAIGLVALTAEIPRLDDLPLLLVLVAFVLLLDSVDVDLFGRGNISVGSVGAIALAAAFGPFGPALVEALAAPGRLLRGTPLVRVAFDFGALSLCGVLAAAVFGVLSAQDGWVVLACAAAGAAYYLANSLFLVVVWGLDEDVSPLRAWQERLAWAATHYVAYGLLAGLLLVAYRAAGLAVFAIAGVPLALLWLGQKQYLGRTRTGVEDLRASQVKVEEANESLRGLLAEKGDLLDELRMSHAELQERNETLGVLLAEKGDLLERVRQASIATVASLARTIEAKDPYTGGHTERVADYSVALARELGFGELELDAIAIGGVIHDVGKVGIREQVLLKPGRLDEEEWAEMRKHPQIASYILDGLELPQEAKDIARHHHERFDGAGYPDGLAGEDIPIAARILSVADTLDAMTNSRPYRDAMSFTSALEEIRANAGTQFCPRVVAALERSLIAHPGVWERARLQVHAFAGVA